MVLTKSIYEEPSEMEEGKNFIFSKDSIYEQEGEQSFIQLQRSQDMLLMDMSNSMK